MSTIIALLLFFPIISMSESIDYCVEIADILAEGVEAQIINEQDAVDIMARCARAPEIEHNSP